jgi:tetratricopeptide (TPR) repeat protein/SAM-dependent methyltransferase
MSHAAKRQKKKVSRKAAMKLRARPAKAGGKPARAAPADYNAQLIQKGFQLQMAGRTGEAQAIYRQILAAKPSHADANHLLGVLAKQAGDFAAAEALIEKAIASNRTEPNYHNNLGSVLCDLGRLEDGAASYRNAIAVKPDFPEAHFNLAGLSMHFGRLDEAIEGYRKAIALRHDYTDAHFKLAFALQMAGRLEDARTGYQTVLAINPNYADAHGNLGALYHALGEPNEAFAHCRQAVALKPDFDPFWNGLAITLETIHFTSADDSILDVLRRLLQRPRVNPNLIARPILTALRAHAEIGPILNAAGQDKPDADPLDVATQLSAIPLFLRVIALSFTNDAELEFMLTRIRRNLLLTTRERGRGPDDWDNAALPFLSALALHCFTNEYVFAESDAETAAVERLTTTIETRLKDGEDVSPAALALLAAYRPLYRLAFADGLADLGWRGEIAELMRRQVIEPREETALRETIPSLTPIDDAVSQSVRAQYEENPYPRWVKTVLESAPRSIKDVLQGPPLHIDLGDVTPPEAPDVLIAGCGTGQHAVTTAANFLNAKVLAVDLSLASLSYAVRQSQALGFTNIEFAQADIMELGRLDRRFDLIESAGVLHHLGDPLAGWRVLTDLLRPGGFMKIALYSELAREPIVAARALIAEKGYSGTVEDIRRCRAEIRAMAADGNEVMAELAGLLDFYGLSNCRDLIFHVQEHRFTLPQIDEALRSLGLEFLRFELGDADAMKRFQAMNPEPDALSSLQKWHAFELEHPRTFARMYQFWCRKPVRLIDQLTG